MALNPSTNTTMSGRITAINADYPYGSGKDETSPGAGDGTPYFKARADDIFGFQQFLLNQAGIVPSGNADTVLASDYGNALSALINFRPLKTNTALADAAAVLTAAQLVGGEFTITPTADRALTVDTAANIITAIGGSVNNSNFEFTIVNLAAFNLTITTSAGVTLVGNMVVNDRIACFRVRRLSSSTISVTRLDSSNSESGGAAEQYMAYGGTANTITLTNTSGTANSAYVTGQLYRFRSTATNTASTTVNVDGLGTKNLITVTGIALPNGYIRTDIDTVVIFDGTDFVANRQIESGRNTNGTFIKFEDGTLIVHAVPRGSSNNAISVSLPIEFITPVGLDQFSSPGTSPSLDNIGAKPLGVTITKVGGDIRFAYVASTSGGALGDVLYVDWTGASSTFININVSAIGRWYL
jgi:hypothetical protein